MQAGQSLLQQLPRQQRGGSACPAGWRPHLQQVQSQGCPRGGRRAQILRPE